ncbi:hypothetical protein GCM10010390_69490 [Streptomyces mordarskii]|uniref:Uncharacterized protein n=1 Tax=Streptomyces mordarskii TaxID=1226758 RepID=A0ABN1E1Q0_9ACTN
MTDAGVAHPLKAVADAGAPIPGAGGPAQPCPLTEPSRIGEWIEWTRGTVSVVGVVPRRGA